jgi:hypothetical protein
LSVAFVQKPKDRNAFGHRRTQHFTLGFGNRLGALFGLCGNFGRSFLIWGIIIARRQCTYRQDEQAIGP